MTDESGGLQATNKMDLDDEIVDLINHQESDEQNLKRKRNNLNEKSLPKNKRDAGINSNNNNDAHYNDNSNEQIIRPKIYYNDKDSGVISVWIKKINTDGDDLSAYKVGSILYKNYKDIVDIRKRGKFTVEVVCKNYVEANKIIDDKNLKSSGLETFVPGYRKVRKGIVRNIPTDINVQEILNSCESSAKVLDVKRLNKRNKNPVDEEEKWIPCRSIVLTFAGQTLPTEITLFKVRSSVEPFVNKPTQCYNCFQFNHTSRFCKKDPICIQCGDMKHDGNCNQSVPKCVNCGENHKSIDSTCVVFQKYHKVNVIMAFDNISFYEAKKQIFGENNDEVHIRKTKENFPSLKEKCLHKFSRSYSDATRNEIKTKSKFTVNESSSYKNSTNNNITGHSLSQEIGSFASTDELEFNSQDFIQNSQSMDSSFSNGVSPLTKKKKKISKSDNKENAVDTKTSNINPVKPVLSKESKKINNYANANLGRITDKLSERFNTSQTKNVTNNNNSNNRGNNINSNLGKTFKK